MVREVKFSCDGSEGIEIPPIRDRFDDEEMLDAFAAEGVVSKRRRARRSEDAGCRTRHLAGADWIEAVPRPHRPGGAVQR